MSGRGKLSFLARKKKDRSSSPEAGAAPRGQPKSPGEKSPSKKRAKILDFFKKTDKTPSPPLSRPPSRPPSSRPRTPANPVAARYIDSIISEVESLPDRKLTELNDFQEGLVNRLRVLQSSLRSGDIDAISENEAMAPPLPASLQAPSARLVHSSLPSVGTESYVLAEIMGAFRRLAKQQPSHVIFGPPGSAGSGLIRAPLHSSHQLGDISWERLATAVAKRVTKTMGDRIPKGSCWMVKDDTAGFQRKNDTGKIVTFKIVRLLGFLREPTDRNWHALQDEKLKDSAAKSANTPFCHNCHNGLGSKKRNSLDASCVNGLEHGILGTISMNQEQAACNRGERTRKECLGHTFYGRDEKEFCFFVHPSGVPKPCRNAAVAGPPEGCSCDPPCF